MIPLVLAISTAVGPCLPAVSEERKTTPRGSKQAGAAGKALLQGSSLPRTSARCWDGSSFGSSDPCFNQDAVLKLGLLKAVTVEPGLDDVELAERLGADPFRVSELLRDLARDGLIQPSR